MSHEADSVDLDNTVLDSQVHFQWRASLSWLAKGVAIYDRNLYIPYISQFERQMSSEKIKPGKEAISFFFHSKRGAKKGIIEKLNKRSTDKFGNTGRSNKEEWVRMTWNQVINSGLTNVKDIFFKPHGIENIISKGAGILQLLNNYSHVTHFDDDPLTILLLARYFKNVKSVEFVLLKDRSAGYLLGGVDWKEFKNVTCIQKPEEI